LRVDQNFAYLGLLCMPFKESETGSNYVELAIFSFGMVSVADHAEELSSCGKRGGERRGKIVGAAIPLLLLCSDGVLACCERHPSELHVVCGITPLRLYRGSF